MRTLPVEDFDGRIIGALMLEDEHNEILKENSLILHGVNNTTKGKIQGYLLTIPLSEE